jgi:hypothetical protein
MHFVIPALAAMACIVMMAQAGTNPRGDAYEFNTSPTAYSMDHAVAQLRGQEDIGAPTF